MSKLADTTKDEGDDSFVNIAITKKICEDPWARLVRYILQVNAMFMHVLFENCFIHWLAH